MFPSHHDEPCGHVITAFSLLGWSYDGTLVPELTPVSGLRKIGLRNIGLCEMGSEIEC